MARHTSPGRVWGKAVLFPNGNIRPIFVPFTRINSRSGTNDLIRLVDDCNVPER
jgi:hypothetical protein